MKNIFWLSAVLICCGPAFAKVTLPAIFSDHAVLQKSAATAVFGNADPGEKVRVVYGNAKAETTAGKDGKWLVRLDLSQCGDSSRDLVISGKNKIVLKDVIPGEVWFCIGQSNMALRISACLDAEKTIAGSANDKIRTFAPAASAPEKPSKALRGRWIIASPRTTGRFTAVGYYFARKINQETGRAFGLINTAWGGSSIESWISTEKLLKDSTPAIAANAKKELHAYFDYDRKLADYIKRFSDWQKTVNWIDDEKSAVPPENAVWKKVQLNRPCKGGGIFWLRKTVEITKKDTSGKFISFEFGRPAVAVKMFLDGKPVAERTFARSLERKQWQVRLPAKEIAPGKHEITLRVSAVDRTFSFPREHRIGRQRNTFSDWDLCCEKTFPELSSKQKKAIPKKIGGRPYPSKTPGMIWNGLVYPLLPYTMKGALWYQGEQNAIHPHRILYGDQVKALVADLRKHFENPGMRFYAVQLPGFMKKSSDPNEVGNWVAIRKGQSSAMNLPGVAEAVIIDLGESNDIHPVDKQPVGERLAAIALRNDYGKKDLPCRGPEAVSAVRQKNTLKIDFKYTDGGLKAKELPEYYWRVRIKQEKGKLIRNSPSSQLEGFAVRTGTGKWVWADAKISGNSVIVSGPKEENISAVRYAWQNNPTCNLYNGAGFPAAPFELEVK